MNHFVILCMLFHDILPSKSQELPLTYHITDLLFYSKSLFPYCFVTRNVIVALII